MITAAATITLILVAAAVVIAVGRAIVAALRSADRRIDTILDEELGARPGDDDQFANWPAVRIHTDA